MRYISLFSGGAGGDLGCQHLLGWECMGYVEWDKYCCRVLEQRIKDGLLSDAPIFCGDIRRWIELGYAESYQGMVDVITAGFPCQPHSRAGKQLSGDDNRDMWPETIGIIDTVQPEWCFLENVPGIIDTGYVWRVTADLAKIGYVGIATHLSALGLGANHKRDRVWFVGQRADMFQERVQRGRGKAICWQSQLSWGEDVRRITESRVGPALPTSRLCRSRNDVANYVDRISAIGNGQVPTVVAAVWRLLTRDLEATE